MITEPAAASRGGKATPLVLLGAAICAYLALNALTQHLVSPTIDRDLAEQMLASQSLDWGYPRQPPLYTWLVCGVFAVTGPSVAALQAVKVVIFCLLAVTILGLGRTFGFSRGQYAVALAGLAFIPQFIWEAQCDQTHSTLVVLLAAATLLQLVRLSQAPRVGGYLLLGLLVGLGILSKYNYALFLVGLLAAALLTPQYRRVILKAPLLLGAAVGAAIVAPHAVWLLEHREAITVIQDKFGPDTGSRWHGLPEMLLLGLLFIAPMGLLAPLLIKRAAPLAPAQAPYRRLLTWLAGAVVVVAIVFVLLIGGLVFKQRWWQPLLFFLPLLGALYASPAPRVARLLTVITIVVAVGVGLALPGRILLAGQTGHVKRPNIPFQSVAAELTRQAGPPDVLVVESISVAGNLRAAYPRAAVVALEMSVPARLPGGRWIILTEDNDYPRFYAWLADQFHLNAEALPFKALTVPYYYAADRPYTVRYAVLSAQPFSRGEALTLAGQKK